MKERIVLVLAVAIFLSVLVGVVSAESDDLPEVWPEFEKKEDNSDAGNLKNKEKVTVKTSDDAGTEVYKYEYESGGEKIKVVIKKTVGSDGAAEQEVEYEGKGGLLHQVRTKLLIAYGVGEEDGSSFLRVVRTDGAEVPVVVSPQEIRLKVKERIGTSEGEIELEERIHKNIPRVVYVINSEKNNGRFVGIFKMSMAIETEIDAETGEVLRVSKPWWAFLVAGEEQDESLSLSPRDKGRPVYLGSNGTGNQTGGSNETNGTVGGNGTGVFNITNITGIGNVTNATFIFSNNTGNQTGNQTGNLTGP